MSVQWATLALIPAAILAWWLIDKLKCRRRVRRVFERLEKS